MEFWLLFVSLGNAVILVKALFEEWYKEEGLSISIKKEKNNENY